MCEALKTETASELIERLSKEFFPVSVAHIAAQYKASGRRFRPHELVLLVTKAWRRMVERGGVQ